MEVAAGTPIYHAMEMNVGSGSISKVIPDQRDMRYRRRHNKNNWNERNSKFSKSRFGFHVHLLRRFHMLPRRSLVGYQLQKSYPYPYWIVSTRRVVHILGSTQLIILVDHQY